MGIYIKNIEMPNSCIECPFKGFDRARGYGNICTINDSITFHAVLNGVDVKFVRMGDCPLIPVPPHGDLIDRRYAIATACSGRIRTLPTTEDGENWIRVEEVRESIKNAPTIIPAEEGE